jgi:hypothetical protein
MPNHRGCSLYCSAVSLSGLIREWTHVT